MRRTKNSGSAFAGLFNISSSWLFLALCGAIILIIMSYCCIDWKRQTAIKTSKACEGVWIVSRIDPEWMRYELILQPPGIKDPNRRQKLKISLPHPDKLILERLCPGDKIKIIWHRGNNYPLGEDDAGDYLRLSPVKS
ncbi:MAG TPA: hypothetical protein VMQ44_02385 [Candidatus Saccharimonadales bacterium]|nr:hypothetical protein [Candidatus Saccharimonadales bacterium]